MIEALARSFKNDLKYRLREKQRAFKVSVSMPYRILIIEYLNQIFGNPSENGMGVWEGIVSLMVQKFHIGSFIIGNKNQGEEGEKRKKTDWWWLKKLLDEEIRVEGEEGEGLSGRWFLFLRLSKLMSLTFRPTTYQKVF